MYPKTVKRNDDHNPLAFIRGEIAECWQKERSHIVEDTGPVKAARFRAETEVPRRKCSMSTASTGSVRNIKNQMVLDHSTRAWINFMIVRSLSPYNGIIGRPVIREIQAVPSTAHGMLKFPVDGGIVTIRSTILIPAKCATRVTLSEIPKEAGVCHENFKIAPHPNFPDQEVAIGETLSAKGQTELCSLLKENLDIFAWQPSDMTGVTRDQ
ncbi:hypothetical protein Tco_0852515 [Tanacetum coccineum]